jgi:hypothetical protein
MKVNRRVSMIIGVAGSLLAPQSAALAQDAISTPQKQIGGAKTEMVPSLLVMNARSATLQGGTPGISRRSLLFANTGDGRLWPFGRRDF